MESNDTIQFNLDRRPTFSFSQPAHVEDLLLGTQLQFTQPSQVRSLLNGLWINLSLHWENISYIISNNLDSYF